MKKMLVGAVVVSLALVLVGCGNLGPKDLTEKFMQALVDGDLAEAYSCMGGRMVVSQEEFEKTVREEIAEKGQMVSYTVGTPQTGVGAGASSTLVPVTLVWEKNNERTEEKFNMPLLNQGKWMITTYTPSMKR